MAVAVADRSTSLEERVTDAALRCFARWGVTKTSLDDVAREAGYSRATVYRLFPGGKDGLLDAVGAGERDRFFGGLAEAFAAQPTLEDLLVAGITESVQRLQSHAALQFLLTYEPGTILPRVAFGHFDEILTAAADFAAPYLARFLPAEQSARAAEWATRIVLNYCMNPAAGFDLAEPASVRRFVRTFMLPGLESVQSVQLQST